MPDSVLGSFQHLLSACPSFSYPSELVPSEFCFLWPLARCRQDLSPAWLWTTKGGVIRSNQAPTKINDITLIMLISNFKTSRFKV